MKKLILSAILAFSPVIALAQIDQPKEIQTSQKFGTYTVHYNVVNSTSIPTEVAKIYKLTRSRDIVYLNISLTKTDADKTSLGLPAKISGTATNLMQQHKALKFTEIKEPEATYYLGEFRHTNEEDFKFDIQVVPEGEEKPLVVSFSRRLFTEN